MTLRRTLRKRPAPALSPRESQLTAAWRRSGEVAITIEDIERRVGSAAAARVASALVAKGALRRVQRGRYVFLPAETRELDPTVAVTAILKDRPHYIGGEWALRHTAWGGDYPPEGLDLDVFVPERLPERTISGVRVRFHPLEAHKFSYGLTTVRVDGVRVRISDLERTILDCVDRSLIFGKIAENVSFLEHGLVLANPKRICRYALAGSTTATRQRMGALLARDPKTPATLLNELYESVRHSRSVLTLFPDRARRGRFNRFWNVVENDLPTLAVSALDGR